MKSSACSSAPSSSYIAGSPRHTRTRRYGKRATSIVRCPTPPLPREDLLHDLEQAGSAHAAADAHGDDHVLGLAAAAFDQDMAGAARAGHAEGMADRDRAAVDVELLVGDAELVAAVEHLHREGLVQFPQIDVVHLEPEALQELGDGVDRADAHLVRLAARNDQALVDAERLQPAPGRFGVTHHHRGRRAVAELAG